MSSRLFRRRGPSSPAVLAAGISMIACAATDVKVDLARAVPMVEYTAKLRAISRCEAGSLSIAYSFGDLELSVEPVAKPCRVRVSVRSELGEDPRPQRFLCNMAALDTIDWLKDADGTRQSPPLRELQATCTRSLSD